MVTRLEDAKIVIQIDVEGAKGALSDFERERERKGEETDRRSDRRRGRQQERDAKGRFVGGGGSPRGPSIGGAAAIAGFGAKKAAVLLAKIGAGVGLFRLFQLTGSTIAGDIAEFRKGAGRFLPESIRSLLKDIEEAAEAGRKFTSFFTTEVLPHIGSVRDVIKVATAQRIFGVPEDPQQLAAQRDIFARVRQFEARKEVGREIIEERIVGSAIIAQAKKAVHDIWNQN